MKTILVAVRLDAAPRGKLPPWGGLLDTAEEVGLWSFAPGPDGGVRPLPPGLLWGRFEDEASALAALEDALEEASELLGYPVTARGRVAGALGSPQKNWGGEIPFAEAEALLYLSHQ